MIINFRILPPGMAHEVFTPISSVAIGSHFYCYDTMPATELAMRLDRKDTESKTNTHHPAAIPMLTHMVLSLPSIYEGIVSTISSNMLQGYSSLRCRRGNTFRYCRCTRGDPPRS